MSSCFVEHPFKQLRRLSLAKSLVIETLQFAEYLDSQDELRDIRKDFHYPKNKTLNGVDLKLVKGDEDCLYFSGNILGLCPKSIKAIFDEEVTKWEKSDKCVTFFHKIRCSLNQEKRRISGEQCRLSGARPVEFLDNFSIDQTARLTGARPIEVISMNSHSANLHFLMVPFYRPTTTRHKILCESYCSPLIRLALESQIDSHDYNPASSMLQITTQPGETLYRTPDILRVIQEHGESIALVLLSGLNYKTGQLLHISAITQAAQEKGCKVGFDVSNAIGNVELKLHDWNVDFACWDTQKYLNSGPVALGGIFIHERYAYDETLKRLKGWWGVEYKERFRMKNEDLPLIPGARGFAVSCPCVWSFSALYASLEIFDKVGMHKITKKQLLLTGYLEYLIRCIKSVCDVKVSILTPDDVLQRGSQLTLVLSSNASAIYLELKKRGLVCEFIHPNLMCVAPVPLYNTYSDVFKFVKLLVDVMNQIQG